MKKKKGFSQKGEGRGKPIFYCDHAKNLLRILDTINALIYTNADDKTTKFPYKMHISLHGYSVLKYLSLL